MGLRLMATYRDQCTNTLYGLGTKCTFFDCSKTTECALCAQFVNGTGRKSQEVTTPICEDGTCNYFINLPRGTFQCWHKLITLKKAKCHDVNIVANPYTTILAFKFHVLFYSNQKITLLEIGP